ncbi:sodium:proton antiporter, partial [Spirulina sp. 06S082]|nr:sodium:proton antiporter [Spirulina sp. 06S082]
SVPVVLQGRQEIIDAVFGVVLFTLLVQGLTTQFFLKKLDLVGDQPQRQEYSEFLARRTALNRVFNYLENIERSPEIDPEFYRYQQQLVKGEIKSVEERIASLQSKNPQLRSLDLEQLREELVDIEADTYAEYIRAGRLNRNLSPLLQGILDQAIEKAIEEGHIAV